MNELVSVHACDRDRGPMDAAVRKPPYPSAGARRAADRAHAAGTLPELGEMSFATSPRAQRGACAGSGAQVHVEASYAVAVPAYRVRRDDAHRLPAGGGRARARPGTLRSYPAGATSFGAEASALAKERFDALFVPACPQRCADRTALAAAGLWSTPRESRAPKNVARS